MTADKAQGLTNRNMKLEPVICHAKYDPSLTVKGTSRRGIPLLIPGFRKANYYANFK